MYQNNSTSACTCSSWLRIVFHEDGHNEQTETYLFSFALLQRISNIAWIILVIIIIFTSYRWVLGEFCAQYALSSLGWEEQSSGVGPHPFLRYHHHRHYNHHHHHHHDHHHHHKPVKNHCLSLCWRAVVIGVKNLLPRLSQILQRHLFVEPGGRFTL